MRIDLLRSSLVFLALWAASHTSFGQDVKFPPVGEQLPPPRCTAPPDYDSATPRLCNSEELKSYLADIDHWRTEERIRAGLNDAEYRRDALLWTQASFIQSQMMVHDRYFYDPVVGHYTVDRYVDDVTSRFGGIDSVLIWPTYPNLGVDDRNQYDLFHDLPGGVKGVTQMVADFHRHGVRVLFPIMLWDRGTREESEPDALVVSRELVEVGADGINGDTLSGIPRSFREASDGLHHPLALEPENAMASDEMLAYNNMNWGYWRYGFAPSVSRYKWLEPRHMEHLSNRWGRNHTDDLQQAFFNGIGFESWENVWGIWNGFTPRDAEAIRRVATMERALQPFLVSSQWEPHTPTLRFGVFASKWPKGAETLWTIVNRNSYPLSGAQIEVPYRAGERFYDLWHGVELQPQVRGDKATLIFDLDANGYGSLLASTEFGPALQTLMRSTRDWAAKPLSTYSAEWKSLPQRVVPIAKTEPAPGPVDGMVLLPKASYRFRVIGMEIEGKNDEGVDVQYPWEPSARRYHDAVVPIDSLWIDKYPVTNMQFKAFMDATHYKPADAHNFLRDWKNGTYQTAWADRPVTWVSIEDARAYAKWAAKRLPHEWEWQYAAQGTDGRAYPWGEMDMSEAYVRHAVPVQDAGRVMSPPSDVQAHPAGASPFGVMDMVGNIWQWTDEYTDEHTRAAIVRGGSHYRPAGTRWYFPQAFRNDQHGKYLLMAPGLDRSGTIGFRCVKDVRQ